MRSFVAGDKNMYRFISSFHKDILSATSSLSYIFGRKITNVQTKSFLTILPLLSEPALRISQHPSAQIITYQLV